MIVIDIYVGRPQKWLNSSILLRIVPPIDLYQQRHRCMFGLRQRKLIASTSPTLNHKNSQTYDNKLDIHDRIQNLEEEWSAIQLCQENKMLELQKILQKIDTQINCAKQAAANFKLDPQIDFLETQLALTANIERQDLLQSKLRLKNYVSSKQKIIEEIFSSQVKEEQAFQSQINAVVDKRLNEIRKKLRTNVQSTQKSKFAKKKQGSRLKQKLNQKMGAIQSYLNDNKEQIKKLRRESQKLIREYLRVKDEIGKARFDREDKQLQILNRIQQFCGGEQTKEETLSKLE